MYGKIPDTVFVATPGLMVHTHMGTYQLEDIEDYKAITIHHQPPKADPNAKPPIPEMEDMDIPLVLWDPARTKWSPRDVLHEFDVTINEMADNALDYGVLFKEANTTVSLPLQIIVNLLNEKCRQEGAVIPYRPTTEDINSILADESTEVSQEEQLGDFGMPDVPFIDDAADTTTKEERIQKILSGLNAEQKKAVEYIGKPQCVIAGAGTGKTGVLTKKIAWLIEAQNIDPTRILAVTFTNKAAGEMKKRVSNMVSTNAIPEISTFHAFCRRLLNRNSTMLELLGWSSDVSIADRSVSETLANRAIKARKLKSVSAGNVVGLASSLKDWSSLDARVLDPEEIKALYDYTYALKESRQMDFGDLISSAVQILELCPYVLEKERARLDWILVDEYQDLNAIQYRLLQLLCGESPNVFVVGDPDQSIYGWRGADYQKILHFKDDFKDTEITPLVQNYRSTKSILAAANHIIGQNEERFEKDLWTELPKGPPVLCTKWENRDQETTEIANCILRTLRSGRFYKDFAVLYRANAMSRKFEETFMRLGIPYRMLGANGFYERMEIKDFIAYFKTALNPHDSLSLERIGNKPSRKLSDKSISEIRGWIHRQSGNAMEIWQGLYNTGAELKSKMACEGAKQLGHHMLMLASFENAPNSAFNYILDIMGYRHMLLEKNDDVNPHERLENIDELRNVLSEGETLRDLIDKAALCNKDQKDSKKADADDDNRVTLATIHAAKGLEFPVVFLVGLEDGRFPSAMALNDAATGLSEERRLCYVGITRAREYLCMSWCQHVTDKGKEREMKPSEFFLSVKEFFEKQKLAESASA